MRRLLIAVIVVAVLYGGYWFVGARAVEGGARDALAELEAQGWAVRYSALDTRGFPSRFDTTVTDLQIEHPSGDLIYAAPFLQAFALSYQPNKIIAAFPNRQSITIAGTDYMIGSEGLRASAAVKPNAGLSFDAATVAAQMLSVATDVASLRSGPAVVALRAAELPKTYDAYLGIERITLPDDLWQQMFPHGALPLSIERVTLNATATLDQELNRAAFETEQPPALTALTLENASVAWGKVVVSAQGELAIDQLGIPTGRITVTARNWETLLQRLENLGIIAPDVAKTYRNMASALSAGSEELRIPINYQNGFVSLGPIPLGLAPRFR